MIQRDVRSNAALFAVVIVCLALSIEGIESAAPAGPVPTSSARPVSARGRSLAARPRPTENAKAAGEGGIIGVWFDPACTVDTLTTHSSPETVTAYVALRNYSPWYRGGLGGWEATIETVGDGVEDLGWTALIGSNLAQSPRLQVVFGSTETEQTASPLPVARGRLVIPHPGAAARIFLHAFTPCSLGHPTGPEDWPPDEFAPAPCLWPGAFQNYDWENRPASLAWASGSEALAVAVINAQPSPPLLRTAVATCDFGDVAPGASRERTLALANIGGGTLGGEVQAPAGAEFELVSGAAYSLAPGQVQLVTLRFRPPAGGTFARTLPLGAGVTLTGTAPEPGTCAFAPGSLDFGRVPDRSVLYRAAILTNATSDTIYGEFSPPFPGWVGSRYGLFLPPGGSMGLPIAFQPYSLAPLDVTLGVGGCGTLRLLGQVSETPPACDLYPGALDFGPVALGWTRQLEFRLTNIGDGYLDGDVSLQGTGFQILSGAGPVHLGYQQWQKVVVAFTPPQDGSYTGQLDLGSAPCGPVALQGSVSHCETSVTEIDFGLVPLGGHRDLALPVHNLGTRMVSTLLTSDNPSFVFPNGNTTIDAGSTNNLPVRFAPQAVGDQVATISTGPGIGLRIACRGRCEDLPPVCELWLGYPDFGQVRAGALSHRVIGITNGGGGHLAGTVAVEGDGFQLSSGAGPFSLAPGASVRVEATFQSSLTGVHSGILHTGAPLCGDVPMTATVPAQVILPDSLDMGAVQVGCSRERTMTVRNPNPFPVLESLSASGGFDLGIVVGPGSLTIPANGEVPATVRFTPRTVGAVACSLAIRETGAAYVRCVARGLASAPVCSLSTHALQFGLVAVGQSRSLPVTVSNPGCGTLVAFGSVQGEGLMLTRGAGNFTLEHGESKSVEARFAPTQAGAWTGAIDLGLACGVVPWTGTGFANPPGTGQDLLGIYFDPLGGSHSLRTTQPFEPVDAYLVLVNPSEPTGISGWECSVEITGGALGPSWTLPGDSFDVASPPAFQVGLRQPRWWDSSLQLASVRFYQSSPQEATFFYIHPYAIPSLPGTPAYAAGGDPSLLRPMHPASGSESVPVAWVNYDDPTAIAAPAPTVRCEDGTVRLSWDYDPARADACRLYRRAGEGVPADVAASALADPAGHVVFADLRAEPTSDRELRYSYALLRDGREIARSPEAAATCAPPAATRLRSIFPNPFNPQATVVFDLARPGPVRLAVYDAGGRLVRILCAEDLPAGTYARVWDGRDEQGRAAASGVYYARMSAEGRVQLSKMSLVK